MSLPPCPRCGGPVGLRVADVNLDAIQDIDKGPILVECPHPCHALAQEVLEAVEESEGACP